MTQNYQRVSAGVYRGPNGQLMHSQTMPQQQAKPMPRMPTQGAMPGVQPQGRPMQAPQAPIGANGPNMQGGAFGQAGSQPAQGYGQNPFSMGNAYGSYQQQAAPGMAMGYGQSMAQNNPNMYTNPSLSGQVFGQLANQGQMSNQNQAANAAMQGAQNAFQTAQGMPQGPGVTY